MHKKSNLIISTKKYDVYNLENPIVQGHIIFVAKKETWRSLCDCFEAAYKWGYDWVEKGYCKSFHILQNVGENYDNTYVSLIPRQGTGQLNIDKIKEIFSIS